MSIKEDIAKMLEDAWNDEVVGEAFQAQARGLINHEISHRTHMIMTGMLQEGVLKNIVRPYITERLKVLEPEIKARLDRRMEKLLLELPRMLPEIIFEGAKEYARSWMESATQKLQEKIRYTVYAAMDKAEEAEKEEKTPT
jgi:hypothetical protein